MNYNEIVYATSSVMKIAGQIQAYSWDDKFCREDLTRALVRMQEALKDVEWTSFSKEELFNLGFGNWDGNLIVIPLHFYNSIKDGTTLYSISGSAHVKGKDEIDNDVRFGCMAYGFRIEDLKA